MTILQGKRKAALWFLQGKSVSTISRRLHMSQRIVESWQSDVHFIDMMGSIESALNEMSDYKLRTLKRKAVSILQKALDSHNPREYQWAVSKLFALPIDLLTSPSPTRKVFSPETQDDSDGHNGAVALATSRADADGEASDDRQSLMSFLDATRQRQGLAAPTTLAS